MYESSDKFKLTISLLKEGGGEVYYKSDGKRFDSCSTLKMNVGNNYVISVEVRPPKPLEGINVMGSQLNFKEVIYDEERALYTTTWVTLGIQTTKRAKREKIPLVIELKQMGSLKLILQSKFYKENDIEHATWGTALHRIDLDCEAKPGLSFIDILKESYR